MFWLRKMKSVAMTSVQKGGLLFQRFFLVFIRFLKVARATWKCSSWQVLWRGWRRQKEAKGQRSPMRPSWESRKWSFFLIFGVAPLLVHLLLPGLLLKEAPHDGDGGDDADDHCLGEDDPCSVLHPFDSEGWSLVAIGYFDQPLHCTVLRSLLLIWRAMINSRPVWK